MGGIKDVFVKSRFSQNECDRMGSVAKMGIKVLSHLTKVMRRVCKSGVSIFFTLLR